MNDPIHARVQQTQRYWYVDGLGELATGLILTLFGLSFLAADRFSEGPGAMVVGLGQPLAFLVLWYLAGKAVRWLKERLTYPRTGYVSYPRKQKRGRLATSFLVGAAVGGATAFIAVSIEYARYLLPVIASIAAALLVSLLGFRLGLVRFYWIAVFTILIGALTAWLPLPSLSTENACFFSLYGLVWMVSGGITLVRYLRSTQPIKRVGEDL